jgi:hypothetical protein
MSEFSSGRADHRRLDHLRMRSQGGFDLERGIGVIRRDRPHLGRRERQGDRCPARP